MKYKNGQSTAIDGTDYLIKPMNCRLWKISKEFILQ